MRHARVTIGGEESMEDSAHHSIHVPSLCEVARRQMLRTEHEAAAPWDAAVVKETW